MTKSLNIDVEASVELKKSDSSDNSSDTISTPSKNSESRDSWDNKFQYMMAALGFAVGLGNIWRFPYLCQKNGGGAFLIPYLLMLVVLGYPLYFLELALGQKIRKGTIGVWSHMNPYLGGIGFASNMISLLIGLYYTTILGWAFFYFFNSFKDPLPWAKCPHTIPGNESSPLVPECNMSSATEYYWYRGTLDISDSVETGGDMNWQMLGVLALAWVLVYIGIVKGIKSSGKVMYFATLFPYFVLIIFFFRGITLDGATNGVLYMLKPNMTRLADAKVWKDAATQIFFSLGLGYGTIIAYSSYNNPTNNCMKDAIFVASANCLTSIFACFTVFSILGFKSQQQYYRCLFGSGFTDSDVKTVQSWTADQTTEYKDAHNLTTCWPEKELQQAVQGTGLAFIAFAEAINAFPLPQLWSVLFFSMLVSIGISSEFGILQTVITTVLDSGVKVKKWKITGAMCGGLFLLSTMFATRRGSYLLDIFDNNAASIGLAVICMCEAVALSWVYGAERFKKDVEEMIGVAPNQYFMLSWKYTSPLALFIIVAATVVQMFLNGLSYKAWNPQLWIDDPEKVGEKDAQLYPGWAVFLAIILMLASSVFIPLVAVLYKMGKFNPKRFGVDPTSRSGKKDAICGVTESRFPLTAESLPVVH